jgi:hypothetical protein
MVSKWKEKSENWYVFTEGEDQMVLINGAQTYCNKYQYLPEFTQRLKEELNLFNLFVSVFTVYHHETEKMANEPAYQLVYRLNDKEYIRADYQPDINDLDVGVCSNDRIFYFISGNVEPENELEEKLSFGLKKIIDELPEYRLLRVTGN